MHMKPKGVHSVSQFLKIMATTALDLSLARPLKVLCAGRGVILALHRVLEDEAEMLVPSNFVTSKFLRDALGFIRSEGWEIIPLGDVPSRLSEKRPESRFVAITLDDGRADNLHTAMPIFRQFNAPFTMFLITGSVDRSVQSVPVLLENFVLRNQEVLIKHPRLGDMRFRVTSLAEKRSAFWRIRESGWRDLSELEGALLEAYETYGMSVREAMDTSFLSWDQVVAASHDPLVTIGAHTVSHRKLTSLPLDEMTWEIATARDRLEARLERTVDMISYPFGAAGQREFEAAKEAGYVVGVMTDARNLGSEDSRHLLSLPRLTLSSVPHAANMHFVRICLYGLWGLLMSMRRQSTRAAVGS